MFQCWVLVFNILLVFCSVFRVVFGHFLNDYLAIITSPSLWEGREVTNGEGQFVRRSIADSCIY